MLNHPKSAIEASCLPIAFCSEAVTFFHEALRSQAWNLVEAAKVGSIDIGIAKVVEVSGEGCCTFVFEDATQSNFGLCGVLHLLPINLFAALVNLDSVEFLVLLDEFVGLLVGYLLVVLHERANGIVINMIAKSLLKLNAVAIGHSHIVHVHAEHQATDVLGVSYTSSHTSPNGNLLLSLFVLPITANHLARNTHSGADMAELDIAMSTLVQVHEVHIDRVPRNLGIILSMEVE